jgi:formyltetrahydrofolate deformylase
MNASYSLRITCADDKGLLHKVTGSLYRRGLNIVENGEYVDRDAQLFFMRTQFTGPQGALPPTLITELAVELKAELPAGALVLLREQTVRRLVVLGTREPHCVGDLLLRDSAGELPDARIQAVVSQYPELGELVGRFGIPFHVVPTDGLSREEHEVKLRAVIAPYAPDYLILAKYMRVLGRAFLQGHENHIINIHHSFLPAFVGSKPYQQAYERGVKIIGATAHFVNENLDEGPIITQSVIPVSHTQNAGDMSRSGRDIERIVLARALKLVLEDRVIVHGRRTLVFE